MWRRKVCGHHHLVCMRAYLSVCLSVYLSVCLSVCLPVCLFAAYLSESICSTVIFFLVCFWVSFVCWRFCQTLHLHLSVFACLHVCQYLSLSLNLFFCPSLSVSLSVFPFHIPVYLSVCLCMYVCMGRSKRAHFLPWAK